MIQSLVMGNKNGYLICLFVCLFVCVLPALDWSAVCASISKQPETQQRQCQDKTGKIKTHNADLQAAQRLVRKTA